MNIDLSCDLGEAIDAPSLAVEAAIWPLITSSNIACGGHVGDDDSMRRSVRLALQHGVLIGAHPSYPDREHFGRKSMQLDSATLATALDEQLSALSRIINEEGGDLSHVKPHGALYNDAHHDLEVARIIVAICLERQLALVASPGSAVEREAHRAGCSVIREGFADRRYRSDGSLQPRSEVGALILDFDEAVAQALLLATHQTVIASDGGEIELPCQTICVHSDMPGAPERLTRIRAVLLAGGVTPSRRGSACG